MAESTKGGSVKTKPTTKSRSNENSAPAKAKAAATPTKTAGASKSGRKLNQAAVVKMLGRSLTDAAFRKKVMSNPEKAMREEGYVPAEAAVALFRSLSESSFDQAAKQLEKDEKKKDSIKLAGDA